MGRLVLVTGSKAKASCTVTVHAPPPILLGISFIIGEPGSLRPSKLRVRTILYGELDVQTKFICCACATVDTSCRYLLPVGVGDGATARVGVTVLVGVIVGGCNVGVSVGGVVGVAVLVGVIVGGRNVGVGVSGDVGVAVIVGVNVAVGVTVIVGVGDAVGGASGPGDGVTVGGGGGRSTATHTNTSI